MLTDGRRDRRRRFHLTHCSFLFSLSLSLFPFFFLSRFISFRLLLSRFLEYLLLLPEDRWNRRRNQTHRDQNLHEPRYSLRISFQPSRHISFARNGYVFIRNWKKSVVSHIYIHMSYREKTYNGTVRFPSFPRAWKLD